MAHNWSGWPGAVCTKCGAEHALENALADNWFDITETGETTWLTPQHEELVSLCDTNCAADMDEEEFLKIHERAQMLLDSIYAKKEE